MFVFENLLSLFIIKNCKAQMFLQVVNIKEAFLPALAGSM